MPVEELNNNIHSLIKDMAELMYTYNGIGLSAPQVGLLQVLPNSLSSIQIFKTLKLRIL